MMTMYPLLRPAGERLHGHGLSFKLKPLASRRNPCYVEWSDLSSMHDAYKQARHRGRGSSQKVERPNDFIVIA